MSAHKSIVEYPEFERYVERLLDTSRVAGVGVAVVQDGACRARGFGRARLDPPAAYSPDTLICVGSCSKSLTAALVACLALDDGLSELDLDRKVADMLPDGVFIGGGDHDGMTLADVLSHRTGMPPHEFATLGRASTTPDTVASMSQRLKHLPAAAPNGATFIYSNLMYSVASHLVESKTGTSFAELLEKRLFNPLQMSSSGLFREQALRSGRGDRIATGYQYKKKEQRVVALDYQDVLQSQGAGGVWTSPNDTIKFIRAMVDKQPPLDARICRALMEKRIVQDAEDEYPAEASYYGLGWDIQAHGAHTLYSHDGGDVGYQACHFFIPELRFGGVVHSNSDDAASLISQLKFLLIDAATTSPDEVVASLAMTEPEADDVDDDDVEDEQGHESADTEQIDQALEHLGLSADEIKPPLISLAPYKGSFSNQGYRELHVTERNGQLLIDGSDRSAPFQLALEHVSQQTMFLARLTFATGEPDMIVPAVFQLDGHVASRLGVKFEDFLDEYIWFDRVAESAAA